ncbi:DgyrCDS11625 [Dimorphilus gyrociliatus]|uniref:DgyrCDS11625 n=1 Tax=Dimorphilus gyrociliatus TaxID=2664684 RepID=A0A7I8W3X7_9ANNE|nr:DgyrCDS11625 [Dimorphilus gyrociliatus]
MGILKYLQRREKSQMLRKENGQQIWNNFLYGKDARFVKTSRRLGRSLTFNWKDAKNMEEEEKTGRTRKFSAPGGRSLDLLEETTPLSVQLNFIPSTHSTPPVLIVRPKAMSTLKNVLKTVCEKSWYEVDVDQLEVVIENSATPLPLDSVVSYVAGFKLYVGVKQGDDQSGTTKGRKSDEDQPSPLPRHEEPLARRLSEFSVALPRPPSRFEYEKFDHDPSLLHVKYSWTEVFSDDGLSKKEKERQNIIWEIVNFEATYALKLQTVFEVFICPLLCLMDEKLIESIKVGSVIANLAEVFSKCAKRWNTVIGPFISEIRSSKQPAEAAKVARLYNVNSSAGDDQLSDEYFSEAYLYNLQIESCEKYIKSEQSKNLAFKKFYEWANNHPKLNKLDLSSYLKSPMHHLTRFALPLERLLQCTGEDEQKKTLEVTVGKIKNFVGSMNEQVRRYEQEMKLWAIEERIDGYDVVENLPEDIISQLSRHNISLRLTSPMFGCQKAQQRRRLMYEGTIRMKDNSGSKLQDVYLFLFSDMILITKKSYQRKNDNKLKLVKPPMRLDVVQLIWLKESSFALCYLNELNMVQGLYTFLSTNTKWYDEITNAKKTYSELLMSDRHETDNVIEELLRTAPPDSSTELLSRLGEKNDDRLGNNAHVCMSLEELESRWPLKISDIRSRAATVSGIETKPLLTPKAFEPLYSLGSSLTAPSSPFKKRYDTSSSSSTPDLDLGDEDTKTRTHSRRSGRDIKRYWTTSLNDFLQQPKANSPVQKVYSLNGQSDFYDN